MIDLNKYDVEVANRINKYLDGLEHNLLGQPIFRLSWANEQFEYREGDFNEFHGDLFLRVVHGVKQTLKYPYAKNCWVLEQWFDPSKLQVKEIKSHNGYEAIYCFIHKFKPLPLNLRVVELIMKAKRLARKSPMLSKSLLQAGLDEKERILDQKTFDAIDPSSPIESSLHLKEGVSYHNLDLPFITKKDKNDAADAQSNVSITTKSGR